LRESGNTTVTLVSVVEAVEEREGEVAEAALV
jgi:hypothetical protein